MATRTEAFLLTRFPFPPRILHLSAAVHLLLLLSICLSVVSLASAQTSQQYVYGSVAAPSSPTSVVSGFSKASQTGALSLVPGSPFNDPLEGGLMAIDGQGKFLFVLNPTSNDISMFQIDQASGVLSEVPGSPFAVPTISPNTPPPSQPLSLAAERSGKFLFVSYLFGFGGGQGPSSVASLAIDTSGPSPLLLTVESILANSGGSPRQLLTDSKGLHLYVGLGMSTSGMLVGGAEVYSIDSSTGNLSFQGMADSLPTDGSRYGIDPVDRFFYATGLGALDYVESCIISPVDGTATTCQPLFFLDQGNVPRAMVAESSAHFLYIDESVGVVVYSIDQATGALTPVLGPLSAITWQQGSVVADPMGPYIYSAVPALPSIVHAYQVDQQTGNLTEIPGSPFSTGVTSAGCCQGLAISGNPVQAISGPAVTIFPATAANFSATAGTSSATQVFSIVNIGNQLLSINSISIAGTNAASFSQTNTCLATLAPNANCSVSINFNPASAGTFTANLQVADNAPGSPQTLLLNGTGVAPLPAVTFSPTTLSFPSTNQGSSSPPQMLTVISSGNTTLHISSVSLAGPNPSDFSFTNNCTAPLAPGANCTISLVFTPTAAGQRVADLMIADEASGSPQTYALTGTGIAVVPALSFSPPVPSFPATTQGTSSPPQTLSVINSGNAPLQISSVSLGGSNASEFSLSSNCTAPLAPAANCTVSLVFSPLASGQRSANLIVADDAPGSPQTISLSATANSAFSAGPAPGGFTTASVSAGQTAQYQLQLTPGAGFTGAVSLACSGAPFGAACQFPASVSLANGIATTFTVTVTTSGPALLPPSAPMRFKPIPAPRLLPLLAFALVLLMAYKNLRRLENTPARRRLTLSGALATTVFCVFLGLTGCGGGSAAIAPPPPVITPSGTSTITVTMSAMSLSGQPLQLQPLQLTLTVK